MFRHVLICVSADPADAGPGEAAVQFAAGYGATLKGLFVREPAPLAYPLMVDPLVPTIPSPAAMEAFQVEVDAHEARQDEAERAARSRFEIGCRDAGVIGEFGVRTGGVSAEAVAAARNVDLVIAGRGGDEASTLGSVAGWMVRHITHPLMIVGERQSGISRIAVAYDASPGAERVLALAADVASNWKHQPVEVCLIHARHGKETQDADLALAERYLNVYNVRHRTLSIEGDAADVIVETAERVDADVLAMGAYGHSLLREVVLGSVTQKVISRWKRPLLLWR